MRTTWPKKRWQKNIKSTFELRGGNPSRFPAKILSTVSSSRGIACSGKALIVTFKKVFLCKCLRFALKAASLRLVCHRLSFSMMCGLMGFCVWRSLPTIALWGFGEVLPSRGTEFEGSLLPTGPCITICRGSSSQARGEYSTLFTASGRISTSKFKRV